MGNNSKQLNVVSKKVKSLQAMIDDDFEFMFKPYSGSVNVAELRSKINNCKSTINALIGNNSLSIPFRGLVSELYSAKLHSLSVGLSILLEGSLDDSSIGYIQTAIIKIQALLTGLQIVDLGNWLQPQLNNLTLSNSIFIQDINKSQIINNIIAYQNQQSIMLSL